MRYIIRLHIQCRSLPAATGSFGMDDHLDRDRSWGEGERSDDEVGEFTLPSQASVGAIGDRQ